MCNDTREHFPECSSLFETGSSYVVRLPCFLCRLAWPQTHRALFAFASQERDQRCSQSYLLNHGHFFFEIIFMIILVLSFFNRPHFVVQACLDLAIFLTLPSKSRIADMCQLYTGKLIITKEKTSFPCMTLLRK